MRKRSYLFLLSFLVIAGVFAQVIKVNTATKSYLNDEKTTSGGYTKDELLSILGLPLFTIDTGGVKRQAISFYFTYKERSIFYDENGRPFVGVDTYGVESENARIPAYWLEILTEKIKKGDTIRFESIKCFYNLKESDSAFYSEPITIYIK